MKLPCEVNLEHAEFNSSTDATQATVNTVKKESSDNDIRLGEVITAVNEVVVPAMKDRGRQAYRRLVDGVPGVSAAESRILAGRFLARFR